MKRAFVACLFIVLFVEIVPAQLNRSNVDTQTQISSLTNMDFTQKFRGDTLPNRLIVAINKQYVLNKNILKDYIAKHKPSEAFIKTAQLNLAYFAPRIYYVFNHNNNFGKPEAYLLKWQKVQDSLFRTIKLNNDDALISYNYTQLIDYFMLREKERLWIESDRHPALFYRGWYHTNIADGKKLFHNEQRSLLIERIINQYFSGKTAEYLYVNLLKGNIYQSNYQNIDLIFAHFKQKYPTSKYIAEFSGPINAIAKKQNQPLNDRMVFMPANGSKLNTLKNVLAITKGKTVLVDMWGTWCSPCREEIEKNSAYLRSSLKGKGVDFLYIANDDLKNEKEWKKLIAYYQMEGMHILANEKLDNDIMNKVKGTGYPTYFIIKKDGSYHLAKTQYPVNAQDMVKELESAAAM
jgi:thiol-disulfide isomerase/thioredoxin